VLASRGDLSTSVARAVTWGGDTALTLPALVLVGALAHRGRRRASVRLGAGVLLAAVAGVGVSLGLALNSWTGRERPPVADWLGAAGGPAFPSGHTTAATLFALSCGWVLTAHLRSGRPRTALWAAAGAYAVLVGWSRVWLGVHWPTDVLGGWLYAVVWSALVAGVMAGLDRRRSRASHHQPQQVSAVGKDVLSGHDEPG
jgi:undecaprenyl-diphosphatase